MQAYEGAREFAELVSAGSGIDKVVLQLEKKKIYRHTTGRPAAALKHLMKNRTLF